MSIIKETHLQLKEYLKGYTVTQVGIVDNNTFIIIGSYNWDEEVDDETAPSSRVITANIKTLTAAHVEFNGAETRGNIASGLVNGKKQAVIIGKPNPAVTFFNYTDGFNGFESILEGASVVRGTNLINGFFYAAASSREIYKRVAPKKWEMITESIHKDEEVYPPALAIDAFSDDDMYFSGEKGELWHFNGNQWQQLDPPCNWNMSYLICAKNGKVYIGGEQGQLLVGRGDLWEEIISHEEALERRTKMAAMVEFKGKIYMADRFRVRYLENNEWIKLETLAAGSGLETLDANDDLMIIGRANEITLFDGKNEEYLYSTIQPELGSAISSVLLSTSSELAEGIEDLIDALSDESSPKK